MFRRSTARRLTLVALAALAALPTAGEETLPTPYTTEQIRDAWREGLQVTTEAWTAEAGERLSRTTVTDWSETEVSISDAPVPAVGAEPSGAAVTGTATWEELRDHALFPAARAERERARRETALGPQEGWLYTVRGEDGSVSELFFSDRHPGPPLLYSVARDGEVVLRAEVVAIRPPS